jgi:hypothetical protein
MPPSLPRPVHRQLVPEPPRHVPDLYDALYQQRPSGGRGISPRAAARGDTGTLIPNLDTGHCMLLSLWTFNTASRNNLPKFWWPLVSGSGRASDSGPDLRLFIVENNRRKRKGPGQNRGKSNSCCLSRPTLTRSPQLAALRLLSAPAVLFDWRLLSQISAGRSQLGGRDSDGPQGATRFPHYGTGSAI